jgi:hypothetical protein
MSRNLTDDDIDAIAHRLTEFSGLTPEEHRDHHLAFAAYIETQRLKVEFWEKVKQQLGGWLIITIISSIGYAAWHTVVWAVTKGN